MRRDDVRFAVAAREDGLRRIRSLTVRIGAVGAVSSAAIAVAFGHPAGAAIHNTTGHKTSPGTGTSQASSPGNGLGSPQPSSSPSSSPSATPRPHKSHPSSSPQPPAQSPAPVATSGQVVSGGS